MNDTPPPADDGPIYTPHPNRRHTPIVLSGRERCPITGKVAHPTREAAVIASARHSNVKTPFKCAVCPGWHIGSAGESHRK